MMILCAIGYPPQHRDWRSDATETTQTPPPPRADACTHACASRRQGPTSIAAIVWPRARSGCSLPVCGCAGAGCAGCVLMGGRTQACDVSPCLVPASTTPPRASPDYLDRDNGRMARTKDRNHTSCEGPHPATGKVLFWTVTLRYSASPLTASGPSGITPMSVLWEAILNGGITQTTPGHPTGRTIMNPPQPSACPQGRSR